MTIRENSRRFISQARLLAWEYSIAFDEIMHIVGCEIIIATLEKSNGNRTQAAKKLRIHRNTLGRWIETAHALGLEVPKWHPPKKKKPQQQVHLQAAS